MGVYLHIVKYLWYNMNNLMSKCGWLPLRHIYFHVNSSIVDYSKSPTIDETVFPDTESTYYWTSTSIDNTFALFIEFSGGVIFYQYKDIAGLGGEYYVRCVRGGSWVLANNLQSQSIWFIRLFQIVSKLRFFDVFSTDGMLVAHA